MLQAVLWDVDGTLAETERDGRRNQAILRERRQIHDTHRVRKVRSQAFGQHEGDGRLANAARADNRHEPVLRQLPDHRSDDVLAADHVRERT